MKPRYRDTSLVITAGLAALMVLAGPCSGKAHANDQPKSTAPPDAQQVVAKFGTCSITGQDVEDILVLDRSVLEVPLSAAEEQQGRQNIIAQFQKHPETFTKALASERRIANDLRRASENERKAVALLLWCQWLSAEGSDPSMAWWAAMMKRHNPAIVANDGFSVNQRQVDAVFADNDWVAQTAGLPASTPESRAAFVRALPAKFPTMSKVEKDQLAQADGRWYALLNPILTLSDLRAKAVSLVKQSVHGPADVPIEARRLEDDGVEFNAELIRFSHQFSLQGMQVIKMVGKLNSVEGINLATRKFMGQGP